MTFANRDEAGRQLAKRLHDLAGREDVIVLGIPRGGVPVAFQVASALAAPLDIFLSRKLGVPGHEELAFGAIAAGEGRYLDEGAIRDAGVSPAQVEQVTDKVKAVLNDRAAAYNGDRPPLRLTGKIVILVDDGIATGASVYAAIQALRQMAPARIILAVPVMPASTYAWLNDKVDDLVCLYSPVNFYAVGQFYSDFGQVDDDEVIRLLRGARITQVKAVPLGTHDIHEEEIFLHLGPVCLSGTLTIPAHPAGLVLFVHGSGSSRFSPRNHLVAKTLQSHGLATLLFDLLTDAEERVDQQTSQYRFNIQLLAERLIGVTSRVQTLGRVQDLPIGYFGASTGAAAALIAAAELPDEILAVVSRGGRPDLAGEHLARLNTAVLLIVGSRDDVVLEINRQALRSLRCPDKQVVVVPGASHLFAEEGTLEQAALHAANWFVRTLHPSRSGTQSTADPSPAQYSGLGAPQTHRIS